MKNNSSLLFHLLIFHSTKNKQLQNETDIKNAKHIQMIQ